MHDTARICCNDGSLSMPVTDPYERELFFEQADQSARRYDHIRLQLGQREWLVTIQRDDAEAVCGTCDQPLLGASYTSASHRLCRRCLQSRADSDS